MLGLAFNLTQVLAQVVLVKPQSTAKFYQPDSSEKLLESWTSNPLVLFRETGNTIAVENEAFITSPNPRSTMILLGAECLSDAQRKAIQEHLDQGNSLFITGGFGSRSEMGGVRGWDFLQNILGGEIDSSIFAGAQPVSLHLRFGLPGTSVAPPGYRWRLNTSKRPLLLRTKTPAEIAGFWARHSYQLEIPDSIPREAGFVVKTTLSGGRIIWIGTGIEGIHLDPVNRDLTIKMLGEMLAWLEGKAIPAVDAWPDGNQSAVLIHGDIEDHFYTIARTTELFIKYDVPVTYNILTNECAKYPEAMEQILRTKAELAVHGDNHEDFAGQPLEKQIERLRTATAFITLYGPQPITFRPPFLSYDENTLRACKEVGYTNFTAFQRPDRDYTYFEPRDRSAESGLVFFPKSELDDYDFVEVVHASTHDQKANCLIGDFRIIEDLGGLYKLNFHTQYLRDDELYNAIDMTLKEIKKHNNVWLTHASSIASWTRLRSKLLLMSSSSSSTVNLTLTNTSAEVARNVVLRVLPPQNVPAELLTPRKVSENCEYDVKNGVLFVSLPPMKPGSIFKMELGAGEGNALSLVNKEMLFTGLKALGALGAIFILWFVMYLAFSGKKISKQSVLQAKSGESKEAEFYRKLEAKGQFTPDVPQPVTPEAGTNFGTTEFKLSPVSHIFPVIPEISTNKPANPSRSVPEIVGTLTVSPDRISPSINHSVESSSSAGTNYARKAKAPSLPVVMKPLTVNEENRSAGIGSTERNSQRQANTGTTAKAPLESNPIEFIPLQKPQLIAPTIETKAPDLARHSIPNSEVILHSPPSVAPKSAIPQPVMAQPKQVNMTAPPKPENNGSQTFRTNFGSRSTAALPKSFTPKTQATGTQNDSPGSDGFEPPDSNPQSGLVRTSADIMRKRLQKASGDKEWR